MGGVPSLGRRTKKNFILFFEGGGETSLKWADGIDYDPAMTHCIVASGGKTIVCIFVSAQGRQCLPDEASLNLALPIFSSCLNWATENRGHGSPRDRH